MVIPSNQPYLFPAQVMGVALNGDSDVQTLHTSLVVGGLGSAGATHPGNVKLDSVDGDVGRLAEKSSSGNGYILGIYILCIYVYLYYVIIYILCIYVYTHMCIYIIHI